MRILSQVKDYYDIGQSFNAGEDDGYCWIRTPVEYKSSKIPGEVAEGFPELNEIYRKYFGQYPQSSERDIYDFKLKINGRSTSLRYEACSILFCGVLYRGVQLSYSTFDYTHESSSFYRSDSQYFWSLDQLQRYLETNQVSFSFKHKNVTRQRIFDWKGNSLPSESPFSRMQSLIGTVEAQELKEWAIKHAIRILAFGAPRKGYKNSGTLCVKDALLSEYDFYRKFSANEAYQELLMFEGAIAHPAPVMVELTDKDKQKKFGFTHEYSFKKEPGQKKRRKNK